MNCFCRQGLKRVYGRACACLLPIFFQVFFQPSEQTKMKLCWKVYAHNRILKFHIMFRVLIHILLPVFFLFQVSFFLLSASVNHTLTPRFYFLVYVYVILSRITGVCCSKKQQHRSVKTMLTCSCGLRGCMRSASINSPCNL